MLMESMLLYFCKGMIRKDGVVAKYKVYIFRMLWLMLKGPLLSVLTAGP
jgi:hypothetical protein